MEKTIAYHRHPQVQHGGRRLIKRISCNRDTEARWVVLIRKVGGCQSFPVPRTMSRPPLYTANTERGTLDGGVICHPQYTTARALPPSSPSFPLLRGSLNTVHSVAGPNIPRHFLSSEALKRMIGSFVHSFAVLPDFTRFQSWGLQEG